MALDPENFKFETPQFDPRFPNQNQTKHCAQATLITTSVSMPKEKNSSHAKFSGKLSPRYVQLIGLTNGMTKGKQVNFQLT